MKTKQANNYRPAAAGEPLCGQCRFLICRELAPIKGEPSGVRGYRCAVIGDHDGQSYRINPRVNRCDRWAQAEAADIERRERQEATPC